MILELVSATADLSHATYILIARVAASVARARGDTGKRTVGVSRNGKRKANGSALADLSDEDDVDASPAATSDIGDDEVLRQAETPEQSDHATEDEDSGADGFAPAPIASQASRRGAGAKDGVPGQREPTKRDGDGMDYDQSPTERELPHRDKESQGQAATKAQGADPVVGLEDIDDDETDDEL